MFEKVIKIISRTFAAIVVFLLVDGFYLSQKGFVIENGKIFFAKEAQAADKQQTEPKSVDTTAFQMDLPFVLGDKNAPITIYEFSSLGCTHCADFHLEMLPKIVKEYVDTGLIKIAFVPFPLDKNSMDAALLAECVGDDKYFAFADVLFKKQRDWGLAFNPQKVLLQYAALSGLNKEKAEVCLRNDITAAMILQNRKDALDKLGLQGTPSFFVVSDKKIDSIFGIKPVEEFSRIINSHLGVSEE
jgi:protein-disulfide isomerase